MLDGDRLLLELTEDMADLFAEVAERRFQSVASAMNLKPGVLVGGVARPVGA
jgi:hypothetical protein